jgi:hypothetical protein
MNKTHLFWYMLLFIDHQKLRREFFSLWRQFHRPAGFALWHQKNKAYWICSSPNLKPKIMESFRGWGIVHMNRSPSPGDIEYISGDTSALRH